MREFELVIDEALKNGLSQLRVTPFNSQLLNECLGFRLGKFGLESYELKDNPIPATTDIYYNWPYPQFITGEKYNFLIVRDLTGLEDIVYTVSDDYTTVDHVLTISHIAIGAGTLMEVADFGLYAFLTNGKVMIYWDTVSGDWDDMLVSPTIPMMRTICNFKGQAVGGNIVSSWHDCDETSYIWSKIGSIDFTPDDMNLSGFRRDPYGGEVYHVRRLGNNCVGYSSKGITAISPVSSPAATFGFTELSDVGLINRGAINGNLSQHIYVGEDWILRRITDKGIEELGYETYMRQLEGEDIIISYDKSLRDFYIGNSSKTFLLSPNGLTEIPQHPSAVWRVDNNTYMLPDTVDDYEALITTHPFDLNYAGQKTVFEMETDLTNATGAKVSVDYYLSPNSYSSATFKPLNRQNVASIIASGNAFAFKLKCNTTPSTTIGYIKARYKMTDMRGIRGVYAPPPRGQN